MKERPMLFGSEMVSAILDGRKTQTRRLINPQPSIAPADDTEFRCPFGRVGDRLWVRETWQHADGPAAAFEVGDHIIYRADYLLDPHGPDGERSPEGKYRIWRPSIHMPRAACRIHLETVAIRAERLCDISETDALAEGVDLAAYGASLVAGFANLWSTLHGVRSWQDNPWVWVITFRRVAA